MGIGAGDLNIKAECRLLIQTYVVEDCIRYNSNTYSSDATFNYSLDSTFRIEWDILISTTASKNSCFLRIGESESKAILVGKVGSGDTIWKVYARKSSTGSGDIITEGSAIVVSDDFQTVFVEFDGTTFNFNDDISITNFNTVSLNKLHSFATWKSGTTSGQVKNIKIKPL